MLDVRSWILEPDTDPSSRPLEELPLNRLIRIGAYFAYANFFPARRLISSGMCDAG